MTDEMTQSRASFWRDSRMPYVESRRACNSRACYRPHSHPSLSIGAVDAGTSVFTGAPQGPVVLPPRSLILVPPGRVHACNPEQGSAWSYQMLHLDAHWLHGIRQKELPRLDCWADMPIRITHDPHLYARFCRLNALLFSEASPHDKKTALLAFIMACDHVPGQQIPLPPDARECNEKLHAVLEWLGQKDADMPTLDELAHLACMSRYQVIRVFRAATGLTPYAWQLNQRINQAREQLQAGQGLAEVAYHLGFSDQSHFQRLFKAHAGVTPGRYRT